MSRTSKDGLAAAAVLAVIGLSVWLRMPGLTQGGFASHDVAGILHEAMVLHDGGLPYVDTIEMKAPGTFWLGKWLAGSDGTDIARFQIWAGLFALGSLALVVAGAWRCFGRRAGVFAGLLYALHDAHLDSIDANYVTWAQLPMVAAAVLALVAPTLRSKVGWTAAWVGAGAFACLAGICKRPAGVVLLVVFVAVGLAGSQPERRRRTAALLVVAGLVAAALPIAIRYAGAGQLGALVDGFVLSRQGLDYVAQGGAPSGLGAVREAVLASVFFVPVLLGLAGFAAVPPPQPQARRVARLLLAWAGLALAAAFVGARFYKGYFLAVAPPLAILAVAPWGYLGRHTRVRPWLLRLLLAVPVALGVGRQVIVLKNLRRDRARVHDKGGRTIARRILQDVGPEDRIWVWGWHLWDVYPMTGLRSGSRIYKSIGLLTPPNDDTWRRPASKLQFSDGPYAQMLLDDLEASRPTWVVLGSTVPRREFEALRMFLRREYRLDRRVRLGRVQFWRRKPPRPPPRSDGSGAGSGG